jgi:hypothetical protein
MERLRSIGRREGRRASGKCYHGGSRTAGVDLDFGDFQFNVFKIVNFGLPSDILRGERISHHQQDGRKIAAVSVFVRVIY